MWRFVYILDMVHTIEYIRRIRHLRLKKKRCQLYIFVNMETVIKTVNRSLLLRAESNALVKGAGGGGSSSKFSRN